MRSVNQEVIARTRAVKVKALLLCAVLAALLWPVPSSGQPKYDVSIRASDGIELEASIVHPPGSPPSGGFPGIVLVHGYGGRKDNMLPFSYILAAYGYASIAYSVRGQGNSGGLSTTDGEREVNDLREVIGYFRASPSINPNTLAVTGGSQGGIHSWMAAVYRMPGVRTVAPLIATPDFARTLVPNGVVRYALPLEMKLGSVRYAGDRDRVRDFIIADQYDSIMAYINARDLSHLVDSVQIPVFQMLGWADFVFPANGGIRAAARLTERGIPIWSYYGTNGHGESPHGETSTFQIQTLVKWFDHWMKGVSLPQDSLPMVYYADDRPDWPRHTIDHWPPQPYQTIRLYIRRDGLSPERPSGDEAFPFTLEYDANYTPRMGWDDTYGGTAFAAAFTQTATRLVTSPLPDAVEITGIPTGRVHVQSDAGRFQAHVRFFDVDGNGENWRLMSRSTNGIRGNTAGRTHAIDIEGTAFSHILPAGHRIGMEITSLDMLRSDQAYTVPYFQSSHSTLHSSPDAPSYLDIPIIGAVPSITAMEQGAETPVVFALEQCYPNPFNPSTVIGYTVGDGGRGSVLVRLSVYDLLGREVAVLVNERQAPGRYEVRFNGTHVASGTYLYRLMADGFSEARKMLLVR